MMTYATRIARRNSRLEEERAERIGLTRDCLDAAYGSTATSGVIMSRKNFHVAEEIVDALHPPDWRKP